MRRLDPASLYALLNTNSLPAYDAKRSIMGVGALVISDGILCPWFLTDQICSRLFLLLHRITANKNQKCDPLRAMKFFIRRKVGHTT